MPVPSTATWSTREPSRTADRTASGRTTGKHRKTFKIGSGSARMELESFQGDIQMRRPQELQERIDRKHKHHENENDKDNDSGFNFDFDSGTVARYAARYARQYAPRYAARYAQQYAPRYARQYARTYAHQYQSQYQNQYTH